MDSQAANRFSEGESEPTTILVQRRRWDLPRDEIIHRGLATNDLPSWMHAQLGRRLALIPIPAGFVADSLLYAAVWWLLARATRALWRKLRPAPRGFPVIFPATAAPNPPPPHSR